MNKEEYLQQLELHLKKHLSKAEIEDILRDYGEFFEDGRRQNKTDLEISAKLGSPEIIAQQFIEEYEEKEGTTAQKGKDAAEIFHTVKDKYNELMDKEIGSKGWKSFKKGVGSLWNGIKWLCKRICVWFLTFFIIGFALLVLSFVAMGSLFFLFAGACLLIATFVFYSFVTIPVIFAGLFGTIMLLSLGLLTGILLCNAARYTMSQLRLWCRRHWPNANAQPTMGEFSSEEAPNHV